MNIVLIKIIIFLAAVLGSCAQQSFKGATNSPQAAEQKAIKLEPNTIRINIQEEQNYAVDVLFLIDSSGSMRSYEKRVMNHLPKMVDSFQRQNENFDFRIIITSESTSFSQLANERVHSVSEGIGSHNALTVGQRLVNEISPSSPSDAGLRHGSVKEFVIVTDDNAHIDPEDFRTWAKSVQTKSGPVHVNGIVRLGGHCGGILSTFSDAKPGTTYQTIAGFPETNGAIEELCSDDWTSVFENLTQQLSQKKQQIKTQFRLPQSVASATQVRISADETPLSYPNDWQLNGEQVEVLKDLSNYTSLSISVIQ